MILFEGPRRGAGEELVHCPGVRAGELEVRDVRALVLSHPDHHSPALIDPRGGHGLGDGAPGPLRHHPDRVLAHGQGGLRPEPLGRLPLDAKALGFAFLEIDEVGRLALDLHTSGLTDDDALDADRVEESRRAVAFLHDAESTGGPRLRRRRDVGQEDRQAGPRSAVLRGQLGLDRAGVRHPVESVLPRIVDPTVHELAEEGGVLEHFLSGPSQDPRLSALLGGLQDPPAVTLRRGDDPAQIQP